MLRDGKTGSMTFVYITSATFVYHLKFLNLVNFVHYLGFSIVRLTIYEYRSTYIVG